MKIKFLVTLITLLLAVSLSAASPVEKVNLLPDRLLKPAIIDNTTYINANRIFMFVTNHGNFGRDLGGTFGYDYGTWFPYTSITDIQAGKDNSPYYAGGLWVGAIDSATKETRVTIAEYSDEYVPGPMANGTFQADRPEFRVYKLFKDSLASNPNQDYLDYVQYAIPQGAPYRMNQDGYPVPDIKGDQFCWSVYNDADAAQHSNDAGSAKPLGLEVKGSVFAFDQQGSLGNIVFLRWRVFNNGNNTLQNCYFSVWSDPDLGGAGDDFVGCDTILSVGYIYNATNSDQYYDGTPPCLGIDFFQGPLRPRTPGDTLPDGQPVPDGKMWGNRYPDSVNMGMYAFNKYINGTDPRSASDSYNRMSGSNNDGSPYTYLGQVLKYMHSGDPVTGTGDLDIAPADRRMWITTGPVTFRPGDSTEILAAMVIGQGTDRLNSITVMKSLDAYAQKVYENDFNPPSAPAKPVVTVSQLPGQVTLSWTDTSEVDQGGYHFEGYTIWQSPDGISNWKALTTCDLVNDRKGALVDTIVDTTGLNFPVVRRKLSNSGLVHSFTTKVDGIEGGRLRDLTPYYFRVTAFSFDFIARDGSTVPNGDRFLESQTTVTAIPQSPVAGLHPEVEPSNTLTVTHAKGHSDGIITPIAVDPTILNGHTYRVTFQDTAVTDAEGNAFNTVWNLYDVTADQWKLKYQTNQTNNDNYIITDGVQTKVAGPAPGVKPSDGLATDDSTQWGWDIPNGTRRFTWANGDGNAFEGFRGAIGWVSLGEWPGGTTEKVPVTSTVRVLLKLAKMDEAGTFSDGDPNVSYAYRYGRRFYDPPAKPEFAQYIINTINTTGEGYEFQDFKQTVPFSAWNVEVDPPQRLTLGFLENNVALGHVEGKYVPIPSDTLAAEGTNNTAFSGPRKWLFIFANPYSTTPDTAFEHDAINLPPGPQMLYWCTFNRRGGAVPFSPDSSGEDQFLIIPSKVNSPLDTFTFVAPAPLRTTVEADLDKITAVPNPFYLYGRYDVNPGSNLLKFHHLPVNCKISIYNLAGDLIKVIDKNDPTPIATWDLLTTNGLPIASGIYIYVVDAPGFGQKIGKVAVFTESEVLKIF